jgi:hypothetical protein
VGDQAHPGQFAAPQLVQDLPGLGVVPGAVVLCLKIAQDQQGFPGRAGIGEQRLTRGQHRVATEQRDKPRNARRDEAPTARCDRCHERVQVPQGRFDHAVEELVVGLDRGARVLPGTLVVARAPRGRRELQSAPARAGARRDRHEQLVVGARVERQSPLEHGAVALHADGRGRAFRVDRRLAEHLVLAQIREGHSVPVAFRRERVPARGSLRGRAHLEHVGEVGAEAQRDRGLDPLRGEVLEAELQVQPLADQHRALHRDRLLARDQLALPAELGVGGVHDGRMACLCRRGERHRPASIQRQPQFRQVAGVVLVEAFAAHQAGPDLAVGARAQEQRPVLDRQQLLARLGVHVGGAAQHDRGRPPDDVVAHSRRAVGAAVLHLRAPCSSCAPEARAAASCVTCVDRDSQE